MRTLMADFGRQPAAAGAYPSWVDAPTQPGPAAQDGSWLVRTLRGLSITTRLVALMVALILFTSASVGVLVYTAVEQAVTSQGLLRVQADAAKLTTLLVGRTSTIRTSLAARAKSSVIAGYLSALTGDGPDVRLGLDAATWQRIVEGLLTAELAAKPSYMQLRIISEDGDELVRVHRATSGAEPETVPHDRLQDKVSRPYVSAALSLKTGEIHTSPIELNREFGQVDPAEIPMLRLATPLDTPDGTRFGVLVLDVDMRPTFDLLRADVPAEGQLYLVDAAGDFLIHPDRSREFGSDRGLRHRIDEELPSLSAAVRAAEAGNAIIASDALGTIAVGWTPVRLAVPGPTLTMITMVPSDSVHAGAAVRRSALGGGAMAALIAAAVVALVGRAIAQPIVAMTEGIAAASSGRAVALPLSHGGEIGVLARALQRYIATEQWYRTIVENNTSGVLTAEPDGTVTGLNRAAECLFGCSAADALGRPITSLVPGSLAAELADVLSRVAREQRAGTMDLIRTNDDGSLTDIALRTSPVRGTDGTLIGVALIARDVTEARTAEEMFRLSVEHSPAGNVLIDRHGKIVLVNREVERRFNYPRNELLGQPIDVLVPDAERTALRDLVAQALADPQHRRTEIDHELSAKRKDGTTFPTEVGLTPVPTRSGLCVLAAIVDISAQKAAQKAIEQHTLDLERSNADLMQFAYVASHDLQEPLRMVASFTQLLADRYKGRLDERADKYIHFAVDGARRMQQLINDLLVYSSVGAQAIVLEPTDAGEVWRRVLTQIQPTIIEAGADVRADALPVVMADADQFARLLQNLLSNALKFRDHPGPKVALSAARDGEWWHFAMTDNGVGFDERDGQRIFEMFQRLHRRGAYEGTGLGLAIVKRIVDQHGGRIWAESHPGEGATFHFTLPATPDGAA